MHRRQLFPTGYKQAQGKATPIPFAKRIGAK
jgi:hypothetical protein